MSLSRGRSPSGQSENGMIGVPYRVKHGPFPPDRRGASPVLVVRFLLL
jgi:hypothetical protein